MPSYLVDELRAAVGSSGSVENATALLIDPADGLRVVNELEQLAAFEARVVPDVRWRHARAAAGIRPGHDRARGRGLLGWDGSPLSCHLMLTAGPRATLGLLSPGDRPIERGDRFTVAFGIWGALTCRAGFVVEDAAELPGGHRATTSTASSDRTSRRSPTGTRRCTSGQTGGALQAIIDRHLGDPFFGIFLNPGHQLHLDEWVNSPIWPGSTVELRSGMASRRTSSRPPARPTSRPTSRTALRSPMRPCGPRSRPGIRRPGRGSRRGAASCMTASASTLHSDVLPFSNLAAFLPPFVLRPDLAMTLV